MLLNRHFVKRRNSLLKVADVGQGDFGDAFERVAGEESLVAGDDDVGEGQQPSEHVVLNDLTGQIFTEEIALFLKYEIILGGPPDLASAGTGPRAVRCRTDPARD
jgi:hypothetical protein